MVHNGSSFHAIAGYIQYSHSHGFAIAKCRVQAGKKPTKAMYVYQSYTYMCIYIYIYLYIDINVSISKCHSVSSPTSCMNRALETIESWFVFIYLAPTKWKPQHCQTFSWFLLGDFRPHQPQSDGFDLLHQFHPWKLHKIHKMLFLFRCFLLFGMGSCDFFLVPFLANPKPDEMYWIYSWIEDPDVGRKLILLWYCSSIPISGFYPRIWLVVWNMNFISPIQLGISSSQLTLTPWFFRGVGVPTTNQVNSQCLLV